jgi:hypothetical protein
MPEPVQWLLLQGLVPVFGAGIFYLAVGGAGWIAAQNKQTYKYDWKQVFDPIGWLYASVVIAAQSGVKSVLVKDFPILPYAFGFVGVASLIVLMAAMQERGKGEWAPALSLRITSLALVCASLLGGYLVNSAQ